MTGGLLKAAALAVESRSRKEARDYRNGQSTTSRHRATASTVWDQRLHQLLNGLCTKTCLHCLFWCICAYDGVLCKTVFRSVSWQRVCGVTHCKHVRIQGEAVITAIHLLHFYHKGSISPSHMYHDRKLSSPAKVEKDGWKAGTPISHEGCMPGRTGIPRVEESAAAQTNLKDPQSSSISVSSTENPSVVHWLASSTLSFNAKSPQMTGLLSPCSNPPNIEE